MDLNQSLFSKFKIYDNVVFLGVIRGISIFINKE